jgi:hypothetical protein
LTGIELESRQNLSSKGDISVEHPLLILTNIGCNNGSTVTSILTATPECLMIKTSGQHKLQDKIAVKDSMTLERTCQEITD